MQSGHERFLSRRVGHVQTQPSQHSEASSADHLPESRADRRSCRERARLRWLHGAPDELVEEWWIGHGRMICARSGHETEDRIWPGSGGFVDSTVTPEGKTWP